MADFIDTRRRSRVRIWDTAGRSGSKATGAELVNISAAAASAAHVMGWRERQEPRRGGRLRFEKGEAYETGE